jgi:DNA-binding NarL/FixJ family response regulator
MKLEIGEFSLKHGLSPREKEIVGLLCSGIITFKDIANKLQVSPSTVSNHLKNIFDKTGTNSKAALLASLLKHVVDKWKNARPLLRKPNILIIDDEPEICDLLANHLSEKGMRVHKFSDPTKVMDCLADHKIDVIISDIRMPKMDGLQLLTEIRKIYHYTPPILFLTGFSSKGDTEKVMNLGAVALLEKPIDMDKIVGAILENFVEEPAERRSLFRLAEQIPVSINERLEVTMDNVGYGGLFIPFEGQRSSELQNLDIGKTFSFQFTLREGEVHKIRAVGEIVWKRLDATAQMRPGVGVKLLEINEPDRELIWHYIRLKRILSFIPSGSREVQALG